MLAFYHYPFVENHNLQEYTEEELKDPKNVESLFDYCQILEAYITKQGWTFLIDYYGYEKLYEIDEKSGWHFAESLEDYKEWVQYEISIAIDK